MKEEEIPELTKLVKDATTSACEWVTNKNGPQVLVLVTLIINEFIKTGAAEDLEENFKSVLTVAWKVFQEDF